MDDKSIEKIMDQRERRYIWLERKLRINLAVTTMVVAAIFSYHISAFGQVFFRRYVGGMRAGISGKWSVVLSGISERI